MLHVVLALLSGALVGFTLGLIGGGGSILATPLLLYVVGLQPHMAIGTGAVAVSVNAFANFGSHARAGNVQGRSAVLFAVIGAASAVAGSSLGKTVDGPRLLFLFAILMIVVGILMLRRGMRKTPATARAQPEQPATRSNMLLLGLAALCVGGLSGFFGIGGGFLIVPALIISTGMPMLSAIGSSLLAVGSFGLTTGINYALSGLIDWQVAAEYIAGGILGGLFGMGLACRLAVHKSALTRIFAVLVFLAAGYMLYRNAAAFAS